VLSVSVWPKRLISSPECKSCKGGGKIDYERKKERKKKEERKKENVKDETKLLFQMHLMFSLHGIKSDDSANTLNLKNKKKVR